MFVLHGDRWVWLLVGTAGAAVAMMGPLVGLSMRAFLDGSASKLLLAKSSSALLKGLPTTKISRLKRSVLFAKRRLLFAPEESLICPDVGLPENEAR